MSSQKYLTKIHQTPKDSSFSNSLGFSSCKISKIRLEMVHIAEVRSIRYFGVHHLDGWDASHGFEPWNAVGVP